MQRLGFAQAGARFEPRSHAVGFWWVDHQPSREGGDTEYGADGGDRPSPAEQRSDRNGQCGRGGRGDVHRGRVGTGDHLDPMLELASDHHGHDQISDRDPDSDTRRAHEGGRGSGTGADDRAQNHADQAVQRRSIDAHQADQP
ncbi:hypothetical protein SDC9_180507 [bioreactor metagenome]|uniref:Uncharacterized protein n=1 Tax=bioreactor metagenome TaxID=1076179 RepID=A0A645HA91_9ZZZZ